jgi:hypothetical protein
MSSEARKQIDEKEKRRDAETEEIRGEGDKNNEARRPIGGKEGRTRAETEEIREGWENE